MKDAIIEKKELQKNNNRKIESERTTKKWKQIKGKNEKKTEIMIDGHGTDNTWFIFSKLSSK